MVVEIIASTVFVFSIHPRFSTLQVMIYTFSKPGCVISHFLVSGADSCSGTLSP